MTSTTTSSNLYFVIMRALVAFNVFKSLFGREAIGEAECGSWVFPRTDGGTGFMGQGDLICPRFISGSFVEAMVSASFLGVFWYLSQPRKPKPERVAKVKSRGIYGEFKRPEPPRDVLGR